MSYQVLARKWRPHNFEEMVGQTHVLRAIINALNQQRLHHAYLFTGTRGVGKTTIARILAKSLNCERGVSSKPCGQCSACREISEGRFIDLIEVDAASRTRVEDTRELLDNVQYTPTRGRYKVYLIDEVHMLSTHSFNALLKTLEEPPPHVKFLLATTDPQKLPATILSRCLQFNLKRMPAEQIAGHLEHILKEETLEFEALAIRHLAHAADGSMRDALSLLDQAIAYGQGRLTVLDVTTMLGYIARDAIFDILNALADHDASAVLRHIEQLDTHAPDYAAVLDELNMQLYQLTLAHMVPDAIDNALTDRDTVIKASKRFSVEDLQLYYQIGLLGKRDLSLAPTVRSGVEMTLLRMIAFTPVRDNSTSTTAPTAQSTGAIGRKAAPATPNARSESPAVTTSITTPATATRATSIPGKAAPIVSASPATLTTVLPANEWQHMIEAMQLKAMVLQLANNCILQEMQNDNITLILSSECAQLYSKSLEEKLQQTLTGHLGKPVKLKITIGTPVAETPAKAAARIEEEKRHAAIQHIEQDPTVMALREQFGAEIQLENIQPVA